MSNLPNNYPHILHHLNIRIRPARYKVAVIVNAYTAIVQPMAAQIENTSGTSILQQAVAKLQTSEKSRLTWAKL